MAKTENVITVVLTGLIVLVYNISREKMEVIIVIFWFIDWS